MSFIHTFLRKLISFGRLSSRRKKLLVFVFALAFYDYLVSVFNFRIKNTGLTFSQISNDELPSREQLSIARDIGFAISLAVKYIPWQNNCRQQSWQAAVLLQHYRVPFSLFVGFKTTDEGMVGHSWVMSGAYFICGRCNVSEYRIISYPKKIHG